MINNRARLIGLSLWCLLVAGWVGTASAAEQQVIISFEQAQGFPAPGKSFTDQSTNSGAVTKWTNDSSAPNIWLTEKGPGGVKYENAPAPISGQQTAVFGQGGTGLNVATMHLDKRGGYQLESFHWAYRGNGNTRAGGDAWLEVECYDIYGRSLGAQKFQGGLDDKWNPKFVHAVITPGKNPLSRVVFRGVPSIPATGHGTFFLDNVVLRRIPIDHIPLIEKGKTIATVVIPQNASKWNLQAVTWLNEYIEKATGTKFNVVTEDKAPKGTLISIGPTKLAAKAGIDISDLKYDGCKLVVKNNVLYLIGRDSTMVRKEDPRMGARGTCRAVLTFLEDFVGVRWFIPTPKGEIIPKTADVYVTQNLNKSTTPAFAYSDGRATYSPGFLETGGDTPASIINNFRDAITVWPGGHTYYRAVPETKYGKTHPEYFAFIDGKRQVNTGVGVGMMYGNHLCSSNPDVKQLLIEQMKRSFDDGTEWMSLGQEDGYTRCECDNCEKLDNFRWKGTGLRWEDYQDTTLKDTPCERLFLLHKAVINAVAISHPDRKVLLMAYAPTAWPSKIIDYFGDNVIIEVTRLEPEYIEAWKDKGAGLTANIYWFNHTCPMGLNIHATPHEVSNKIRYLEENNVVGLYQYGQINWGYHGPSYYVLGKMMGDTSLQYSALTQEFCQGVFGQGASAMLAYYNLLYERLEQCLPQPTEDFSNRNIYLPRWLNTTEMYLMMYPPNVLKAMQHHLDLAATAANTDLHKGWVKHAQDCFDFTKYLTHALIAHRAWQTSPSPRTWKELADRVEDFDLYRDRIINYEKSYTDNWFPAHAHFANWLTIDTQGDPVYYTHWDKRKAQVIEQGIRGKAIGIGDSYYHSFVKEPLTYDFSKSMPTP